MQSVLENAKITKDKLLPLSFLKNLNAVNEFIFYTDNILEGITLLNILTSDDEFLKFLGVIYEPIDQPIYVFQDESEKHYAIKICGCYDKWDLPENVAKIVDYVDLPDYVVYSLQTRKVVMAGENTETASVGNSQWQREGRKLGAAKCGVPFVYQTFYSGRDESLGRIREPNALQVYAHLVYSVRYKTPSLVCYLENTFENSATRIRETDDGEKLLRDYIKINLLCDADRTFLSLKKRLEFKFYKHMIAYLKEVKYTDLHYPATRSRLCRDFFVLPKEVYDDLLEHDDAFIDSLIGFLYEKRRGKINGYLNECALLDFKKSKFFPWNSYNKKHRIQELIGFLHTENACPRTYAKSNTKVGFANLKVCKAFLCDKYPDKVKLVESVLDEERYEDVLLLPLRIYKKSKGKMTFSPDPESGEIVAFSELFARDLRGRKTRPVVGYCIVDLPETFTIGQKYATKLYKALSRYVDLIVFSDGEISGGLAYEKSFVDFAPPSIVQTKPKAHTEETAVVSAYLNQSTINSDWKLCFIHTHHSSWQLFTLQKGARTIQQKIDRVSTKVDLIMQRKNLFMLAEGKETYHDIIRDGKIKRAMLSASEKINGLFKAKNEQFDAFVYNLHTVPSKDPAFYVEQEAKTVAAAIEKGHFSDVAYHESFVVIIVYLNEQEKTGFKLVYSPAFDQKIKKRLDKEFRQ